MISAAMQDALNDQIQAELSSAYLYLSFSAWCETSNLQGHAAWMRKQAREEVQHAMRIFSYINDQNGKVTLRAIDQPPTTFKSPLEVWQKTLANEQGVTARIHKLCDKAAKANDHATLEMLQWFVKEQVEEEKAVGTILEQVKMIGAGGPALFFLDRHLGKDASAT
jgi:ferritin